MAISNPFLPRPPFPFIFLSFLHQIFIRHLPVQHILDVENQWWIKLSVCQEAYSIDLKIFSSCLFQRSLGQNTLMKFMGKKANMDNFHWVGEKVQHQPLAAAVRSVFSGGLAYIQFFFSPRAGSGAGILPPLAWITLAGNVWLDTSWMRPRAARKPS